MRYPGGKNAEGTWQWLCSLMPMHARYCEPFAGSYAVGRRKVPALESFAIDRDATVCRWLASLAIPGVRIHRGCGIRWLREHAAELDDEWLVFLDPPYPLGTRTKKRIYRHELSDKQHAELLNTIVGLRARVMISSYDNPLYNRRLAGWPRYERPVITRGRSWRTEIVWCNFSADIAGHVDGARCALPIVGRDFRERERIKRLLGRWRHNYRRRPAGERRAILAALLAAEASIGDNGDAGSKRRAE